MPKFAKGNNSKTIKYIFFKVLPGYLLIIFYQLTKFEATCVIVFEISLFQAFNAKNLQKAIAQKTIK